MYAVSPLTVADRILVLGGISEIRPFPFSSPLGPEIRACITSVMGESDTGSLRLTFTRSMEPPLSTWVKYRTLSRCSAGGRGDWGGAGLAAGSGVDGADVVGADVAGAGVTGAGVTGVGETGDLDATGAAGGVAAGGEAGKEPEAGGTGLVVSGRAGFSSVWVFRAANSFFIVTMLALIASRLKIKKPKMNIANASQKSIAQLCDFPFPVGEAEGFFSRRPFAGLIFVFFVDFSPVFLRTATDE